MGKSGGPSFQEGSLQLFYRGKDLLLGAQIKIIDSASSLIFDEQLTEPSLAVSSRLEGLWWRPTNASQVSIAISNTTDSVHATSLGLGGGAPTLQRSQELILEPHQTLLVDPTQGLSAAKTGSFESGGVSINYSGAPGSVFARTMIQDFSSGFSSSIQLTDPAKAKSSRLHGAGLRLGETAGEEMTLMVAARNISETAAVLRGSIRYTRSDGSTGVIALGKVRLSSGEVKAWDAKEAALWRRLDIISAGLEFDYSTGPGSVLVSALSISRSGNQVFQVPMLDPKAQKSSTGVYPFYLDYGYSTVVYIMNTTAVEQKYITHFNYEGGQYMIGVKTIAAGETAAIDIRALRDNQVADEEGRTIPLDVMRGQARWTIILDEGSDLLAMIGRSELVNETRGISSTYACQNCCGDHAEDDFITPEQTQMQVGQNVILRAFEERLDCYGYPYAVQRTASWSSDNTSVATVTKVSSGGRVTSVGAGQTTIHANWQSLGTEPQQCGGPLRAIPNQPEPIPCCTSNSHFGSASANVLVFRLRIRASGSSIHFEDSDVGASIVAGETFGIIAEAVDANGNVVSVNAGVSTSLSRTLGSDEIGLPASFNLVNGSFTSGGLLFNRVTGTTSGTSYRFASNGGLKDFFLYTYFQVLSTREGLVGNTTSCGNVVQPNDHFISLPVAQLCNTQVVVRNPFTGQSEAATKRDKGPHFPGPGTACDPSGAMGGDFYWNTGTRPRVESLSCETGNNNSGIDLADGTFAALGFPSQVVWRFGVF